MKKICKKCNIEKEISYFYYDLKSKDNFSGRCKECDKSRRFKNRFKMPKDFDYYKTFRKLEKINGGKCFICEKKDKKMCLDHNHKTKKIRGILCDSCNRGIGLLNDDIILLQKAIDYLKN
jgi:hypothetical protein